MNNNSIFPRVLLQLIALFLGAAILTTLTQHSFNSIGTAIDEAVNNQSTENKHQLSDNNQQVVSKN